MLTALAWRNLWRNKLRSAIVITAIAIGITGGIVTDGMMVGMTDQRTNSAIANEISNIQIESPKFLLNNEIRYTLPKNLSLVKKIKGYKEVKGVTARLLCGAMAGSASAGAGIKVYGVNPSDEKAVSNIYKHIIKGAYLNNNQKIPAVIGEKLAKKLDLQTNDRLIVTLADTSGTITSGAFQIVGIYKTSNNIFDAATVFVRKNDLAALLGFSSDEAHQIAIRLQDNSATDKVLKKIKSDFAPQVNSHRISVKSWYEVAPLLRSMVEMMNMFSVIFMVVILIALAFAIVNTMIMSIMERTREFGMLMALGLNKKRIFTLIMLETLFLALTGALLGLAVSLGVVRHYQTAGFDLTSVAAGMNSIGYSAMVYFRVNTDFYITTIALVILTAFISAISPARKALKLQPATAIRDEQL